MRDDDNRERVIEKANLDVELTLEVLQTAPYLDLVVLVSGDGDFAPLLHEVARMGKETWVIGPDGTATELIRAAHIFKNISEIQGVITETQPAPSSVEECE